MYRPGLFDGSFAQSLSASLAGENAGAAPQLVEWQRGQFGEYSTFYTDMCLEQAIGAPGMKVAWLIEPPSLQDNHYTRAVKLEDTFDYILTFDTRFWERGDKWLYYPFGGSWIAPEHWGVQEKAKQLSIIASFKNVAVGHKLRHEIVNRFGGRMDVWGSGYTPVDSKTTALAPYRYSIVVESVNLDAYFSEKLVDCFSQGTVPIYWGCPTIGDFFDPAGIIPFEKIDELGNVLQFIGEADYEYRLPAIRHNLELAKKYTVTDDWICRHYLFLFEGANGQ